MNKPEAPDIVGCTDGGCIFGHPGGMHTNGGCACLKVLHSSHRLKFHRNIRALRNEIRRQDNAVLTATAHLELGDTGQALKVLKAAYHRGHAVPAMSDRSDDKRDIDSVLAHLRFGDSDGQDHDAAADEIERLRERLARFEQSCIVVRDLLTLVDRLSGTNPEQSFAEVTAALAYLRGDSLPEVTP